MSISQIVKDYELISDIPNRSIFFGGSAAIKDILFHVFPDPTKEIKVLDVGFGVGLLGQFIKSSSLIKHWEVDGIDGFFDTCCNKELFAQHIYRNVWHGLAQDLGEDLLGGYDLICLLDVIEHLDPESAKNLLISLLSALKPDGRLYLSTPLFFYVQGHVQDNDLEEHKIGIPASSMIGLKPLMYVVNLDGLCGNFIFSKNSLKYIEHFKPTTDKGFGSQQGLLECAAYNLQIDDGRKTIYSVSWDGPN
jgi:SAM-dependent methyltransferase